MIKPPSDEEIDRFGRAAKSILDFLFPELYQAIIVIDPSFDLQGMSNIKPQFSRGDFFAVSSVETLNEVGKFHSDVVRFSPLEDIEVQLEYYRPTHAIFASSDLGVLTAWAQGDYAVVAFKRELMSDYKEWFESMSTIGVLREIG